MSRILTHRTQKPSKSKYGNRKVTIDGYTFDSVKEGNRYMDLKYMLLTGVIRDLELQKKFVLDDGFRDNEGKWHRDFSYVCDFYYYDNEKQEWIIEDVKSEATKKDKVYRIKKRFMAKYGLKISEV
jgi:hypothetical protein